MKTSSLHGKTIRPGSLNGYSYYYSNRQPQHAGSPATKRPRRSYRKVVLLIAIMVVALPLAVHAMKDPGAPATNTAAVASTDDKSKASTQKPAAAAPQAVNYCAGNTEAKMVKIDLSERHLWACEAAQPVYDAPIISGMAAHAETITPAGTYEIYGHQQDARLTGADSAGSWDRQVSYWMPFLHNQYGIYGFHDAQWRPDSEFGTIDPNSDQGSHGCVELPLAAMGWLYEWSVVGTVVVIEN